MSAASPQLAAELSARLDGVVIVPGFGQAAVEVPLAGWRNAAAAAREDLGCPRFDWLGAEDAGRSGAVGGAHVVLLHVVHPARRLGLLLRTTVGPDEALPSVADLWAGADWAEREVAEMFGVALAGRAEPRRLLLAESFDGHPLRKDFVLASRAVTAWPGRLEPGQPESPQCEPRPGRRRRLVPPGVPDENWGQP